MSNTRRAIKKMADIKRVNDIIDDSELVRMAEKHFDEESVKKMVSEIKADLKKLIEKF
jgi:hypothetical protein